MSEMVERVAKAIAACRGRDPDDLSGGPHPGGQWLDEGEPWWHGDVEAARAAIEAMREPTEAMIEAYFNLCSMGGDLMGDKTPADAYRAMIDAALKD